MAWSQYVVNGFNILPRVYCLEDKMYIPYKTKQNKEAKSMEQNILNR